MAGMYPELRTMVRGCYDLQGLRIMMGNRIVGNFKAKLGQLPGHAETELDEASKKLLAALRAQDAKLTDAVVQEIKTRELQDGVEVEGEEDGEEKADEAGAKAKAKIIVELLGARYKAITENRKSFPQKASFKGDPVISNYTELCLVSEYMEMLRAEKTHFNRLENVLGDYEFWNQWLVKVRGVGRAMGGVILSEIDIRDNKPVKDHLGRVVMEDGKPKLKMLRPSGIIKYAGLDCAEDGMGRSRRKEHLVDVEYTDKNGKKEIRKGITFNPFLKTKLIGVLGPSFLRAGDSPYAEIYRNYKNRMENHAKWGKHNDKAVDPVTGKKFTSPGRRHSQALRYSVKCFLMSMYDAWRRLEGLPVSLPYAEEKLGRKHNGPQGFGMAQGAAGE